LQVKPPKKAPPQDAKDPQFTPEKPMRVAICFFGLTRSLTWTVDSIRNHLLEPLTENGVSFDLFLHTYRLNTLENPRAHEKAKKYTHLNDYQLLGLTR
jgi:hypothetical protein